MNSVMNVAVNNVVSVLALAANVAAIIYIFVRARKLGVNPYKQEVFIGTRDYETAYDRILEGECTEKQIAEYAHAHEILDVEKKSA